MMACFTLIYEISCRFLADVFIGLKKINLWSRFAKNGYRESFCKLFYAPTEMIVWFFPLIY